MARTIYAPDLPTTGSFSFAEHYSGPASALADATQARASVRALLKESKRSDGDKDYLRLLKTLDDYLPHLYAVISAFKSGDLIEKQRPIFSWRTTLSTHTFTPSSPRLSLPDLPSEHAFALLTYASAHAHLANLTVSALGDYERSRSLSDSDRRDKDAKLAFAVNLLCRAAGVYAYVADIVIVQAEVDSADLGSRRWMAGIARPPELTKEVASGLSKLALASAQTLAIRKLLTKAAQDLALSPGPPLPKSHPSPALIAKLHLGAAELCASAAALLRVPGASRATLRVKAAFSLGRDRDKGKGKDGGGGDRDGDASEVSPDVVRAASDAHALHTALAHKWLGVDAGEGDISARGGHAVGFLTWSRREMAEMKKDKGGGERDKGKGRDGKDGERDRGGGGGDRDARIAEVDAFLRHYKKLNDALGYKPVPSQAELQASIPAGRTAVTPVPFVPPTPAFGPGSPEHARERVGALDLDPGGGEGESEDGVDGEDARAGKAGEYAGRGSYF